MGANSVNTLLQKGFTILLLTSALIALLACVEADGAYSISWSTIDGGGQSSGGQYVLTGTIGQPDAAYSESGGYKLLGGFWPGGPLCFVEFDDFARFAQYWLRTGSNLPADLDGSGFVDWIDLQRFVYEWLYYCPYNWPLR